jgi:hypothetical protein
LPLPECRGARRGGGQKGLHVTHRHLRAQVQLRQRLRISQADIDGIRRQLSAPGWSRIVEARSRKEQTDVDVYLLIDGGKARGLAVIASEPREFAIVNIVGSIDLEQLHDLEGQFGVPELQIESGKKPATPAAPKETSKSRAQ